MHYLLAIHATLVPLLFRQNFDIQKTKPKKNNYIYIYSYVVQDQLKVHCDYCSFIVMSVFRAIYKEYSIVYREFMPIVTTTSIPRFRKSIEIDLQFFCHEHRFSPTSKILSPQLAIKHPCIHDEHKYNIPMQVFYCNCSSTLTVNVHILYGIPLMVDNHFC